MSPPRQRARLFSFLGNERIEDRESRLPDLLESRSRIRFVRSNRTPERPLYGALALTYSRTAKFAALP